MRNDIKLVFAVLIYLLESIDKYNNDSVILKNKLVSLQSVLENQSSESIEELAKSIKNVTDKINLNDSYLTEVSTLLRQFVTDFFTMIPPIDMYSITRVDTIDISFNYSCQIYDDFNKLKELLDKEITEENKLFLQKGGYSSFPYYTPSSYYMDKSEDKHEVYKQNYFKLCDCRDNYLLPSLRLIEEKLEKIESIYYNYLDPLESLDDEYYNKLRLIYNTYTPKEEIKLNVKEITRELCIEFFKNFGKTLIEGLIIAILTPICPPAGIALGVLFFSAECTSALTNPNIKRDGPIALIEGIGQSFSDTLDTPEGIVGFVGGISGFIVGSIAGAKIGKFIKPYTKVINSSVLKNIKGFSENPAEAFNNLKNDLKVGFSEIKGAGKAPVMPEGMAEGIKPVAEDIKPVAELEKPAVEDVKPIAELEQQVSTQLDYRSTLSEFDARGYDEFLERTNGNSAYQGGNSSVYNRITGTAGNMPSTEIPTTFKLELSENIKYINPETGTNTLWTNSNATKHMGEYISRFGDESWSIGVRSQAMLESYEASVNQAMETLSSQNAGRYFGTYGNWELGINTETGVVYHARMLY